MMTSRSMIARLATSVVSVVVTGTLVAAPLFAQEGILSQTLSYGDEGEQVTLLQTWLASDPELYPEAVVNGIYGAATEAAVKRYQVREGMVLRLPTGQTSYGIVGPMTRANLNADFSMNQGGIAIVEGTYDDALSYDGVAFVPLLSEEPDVEDPVLSRVDVWIHPAALSDRNTLLLADGNGYTVGLLDGGHIYAQTETHRAVTKRPYVEEGMWQHLAVLFTEEEATFLYDDEPVETVPLVKGYSSLLGVLFDRIASVFGVVSLGAETVAPPQMPQVRQTGFFDSIGGFFRNLFGLAPPEPVAVEPTPEPAATTTEAPSSEPEPEPAPAPVPLPPAPPPPIVVAPRPVLPVPVLPIGPVSTTTGTTTATSSVATTTAVEEDDEARSSSGGGGGSNAKPVITLKGNQNPSIEIGRPYNDPGATATDAEDGSLTSKIVVSGEVKHNISGDHILTYEVTDSAGQTTRMTRKVTVLPPDPVDEEDQEPEYPLTSAGESVEYQISSAAGADPKFITVDVDPLHVFVGNTQTFTVTVSSPDGVASVTATTELDTTTLVLELEKISESGTTATFEASWVVYDTHVRKYTTEFVAVSNSGEENSTTMAWSDPCSGVMPGNQGADSTLGADCTVSQVWGLDGGTLTIPNGRTLTINNGGTWGFNPGTSIIVNGVLAKGSGGLIRKGYLYYADCTQCVDTGTMYFFTGSSQSGYIRTSTYAEGLYYGEGFYCFAPDTLVLMADGSRKPIKDIGIGDMVLSQSADGTQRPNIVTRLIGHHYSENSFERFKTLRINESLVATAEHPMMTTRGVVAAGDLELGDTLISVDGTRPVVSLEEGPGLKRVYNLTVYPDHTYFAGDMLVHNKGGHEFYLPP